jgi:hypothetical protein
MAYSDFDLNCVRREFSLELSDRVDLFCRVREVPVSPRLRAVLDEGVPLAVNVSTDKMRAEFITAPILAEARRLTEHRISLFSGTEFNVSDAEGLNGTCDFMLAASRSQLILRNPVLMITEAKNEDIPAGLGPCAAAMVAARLFNEQDDKSPATIYGAVTTGTIWRFLKLERSNLWVDDKERYLHPVGKILAILLQCVGFDPATIQDPEARCESSGRPSTLLR